MAIYQPRLIPPNYTAKNEDFSGTRALRDVQEIIEYQNKTTIRIWHNVETANYSSHWHNALEIILPLENHYAANINDVTYTVQPGEILIIPPGSMHTLLAPDSGRRFIFLFDISFITKLKGFSGIQSLLIDPLYITSETHGEIYEDVYQLLLRMTDEYFGDNEYKELTIHAMLLNFFVKLGHHHINTANIFPDVKPGKQKAYVQKFNELLDYIDTHYMEDLTLEAVADSVGFSKYHFSRLFKQYTNFTFCDYVNYRRIRVAEELLSQPGLSITEIALQAGFPSISTFNRLFKQQKNCSPSEYRNMNHQPRYFK